MNIGDKVREIHGMNEGYVKKIHPNNVVDIEIEDGFIIPILKSQLVVVNVAEDKHFDRSESAPIQKISKPTVKLRAEKGLYIAVVPASNTISDLFLLNNTDLNLLVAVFAQKKEGYETIATGMCEGKAKLRIKSVDMSRFEQWSKLLIQYLPVETDTHNKIHSAVHKQLTIQAKYFQKEKVSLPIINAEGYLIRLDENQEPTTISAEALKNKMLGGDKISEVATTNISDSFKPARVPSTIDLHIEALTNDPSQIKGDEIIRLQLDTFDKSLDRAIASGMSEITFIHGTGNGILRMEIHRRLSRNKQIKFFKDADKGKFGYGATYVSL